MHFKLVEFLSELRFFFFNMASLLFFKMSSLLFFKWRRFLKRGDPYIRGFFDKNIKSFLKNNK